MYCELIKADVVSQDLGKWKPEQKISSVVIGHLYTYTLQEPAALVQQREGSAGETGTLLSQHPVAEKDEVIITPYSMRTS